MTLHIFTCENNPKKYGFTPLRDGSNLPVSNNEKWKFWKTIELNRGDKIFSHIGADSILDMIEKDGFAVITSSVSVVFNI